ncbi:MAG: cell envelope integrity protein TolA [Clostridia bacterium]|nr:cell envelope integrity protein TolA [Clostridia bacterium]
MGKIQSVKGVKNMYEYLQKNAGLVSWQSKSPEFRRVVTSEEQLMKLYEGILLNGSNSSVYNGLINDVQGANPNDVEQIIKKFKEEIRKDIDLISKKSHMIRTNELARDKVYYNGKSMKEVTNKFAKFMAKPDFYDKLSPQQKDMMAKFLKVEEFKGDKNGKDYQVEMENYYKNECQKAVNSQLLPFVEKVLDDPQCEAFFTMASRYANGQVSLKNLPKSFPELNLNVSESEASNIYSVVQLFMHKDFAVEGEFEPEKIKEQLLKEDTHNVHTAKKSSELTTLDIAMIFANTDKFNKPKLALTGVDVEGQIYAQPSDPELVEANLSYKESLRLIKQGLIDVKKGKKMGELNPAIRKYVSFLKNNCPSIEFLPNIGLADATTCRLQPEKDASKSYEAVGQIEKYLVDGPRFTICDVEDMLTAMNSNDETNIEALMSKDMRKDVIARVMNGEIDARFLTEEEMIVKYEIEDYFRDLPDEQKDDFITSEEEYLESGATCLTKNDLKILFSCFAEHAEEDKDFKKFNISQKDFESNKNGKPGKMLQTFNCSYEEFFEELHKRYEQSLDQEGIFAADDPYTPYLRYILGYCPDITYAPSVGMTTEENAREDVFASEDGDFEMEYRMPLTQSKEYSNLVLSLPSVRNLQPRDISFLNEDDPRLIRKVQNLKDQREILEQRLKAIEERQKQVQEKITKEKREPNEEEKKTLEQLAARQKAVKGQLDSVIASYDKHYDMLHNDLQVKTPTKTVTQTPYYGAHMAFGMRGRGHHRNDSRNRAYYSPYMTQTKVTVGSTIDEEANKNQEQQEQQEQQVQQEEKKDVFVTVDAQEDRKQREAEAQEEKKDDKIEVRQTEEMDLEEYSEEEQDLEELEQEEQDLEEIEDTQKRILTEDMVLEEMGTFIPNVETRNRANRKKPQVVEEDDQNAFVMTYGPNKK